MILVTSRFRVANGLEAEVAEAFRNRPHLVDAAPGFLGMEVFTDTKDAAVFCLVTRWTDVAAYQAWHRSDAHRLSHRGIPRGLKVEGGSVEVRVLARLDEGADHLPTRLAFDATSVLALALEQSAFLCWAVADRDGTVRHCNQALAGRLRRPVATVVGEPLWGLLTEADATSLRQQVERGDRGPRDRLLVNFVDSGHCPFTLDCRLDVQPDHLVLLGEPLKSDESCQQELVQLNNRLAVLTRENARRNKLLEKARARLAAALEELETTYWHLKKIQEVLPICMECGKVKTGAGWEGVVDYLKKNSLFLSHGYCPVCTAKLMSEWGLTGGGEP